MEKNKKLNKIIEQNKLMKSLLLSIEDAKHGRVKEWKLRK
jgi:hypothetical protein